jgi:hypothetical protein
MDTRTVKKKFFDVTPKDMTGTSTGDWIRRTVRGRAPAGNVITAVFMKMTYEEFLRLPTVMDVVNKLGVPVVMPFSTMGGPIVCDMDGGGRRCQTVDCTKSAIDDTGHCKAHGGGRRCQHEGCSKAAVQDGTDHCKAHGGGRRCQHLGCPKSAASGGTQH